jgi:hypothetical protein
MDSQQKPPKKEDLVKGLAGIGGALGTGAALSKVIPSVASDWGKAHPMLRGGLYAAGLSTGGLLTRLGVDKVRDIQYKKKLQQETMAKVAKRDLPDFTRQDRPEKVKEIYRALKRDHPNWPAGKKARIANAAYNKMEKKATMSSEMFTAFLSELLG